eukprot:COSAG01_NODE_56442_length_318_cov_0.972603_1_plen_46_part_01
MISAKNATTMATMSGKYLVMKLSVTVLPVTGASAPPHAADMMDIRF